MACKFKQILTVEATSAQHLIRTIRAHKYGLLEQMYIPWHRVCTIGLSSMTIDSEKQGKQRIYTTKLTFVADDFPLDHLDGLCFRVMTVQRFHYVIGDSRKPYCLIETSENFPSRMSDSSQKQYTVTWKSLLPPVLAR